MADISKIILPNNNIYNIKDGSALHDVYAFCITEAGTAAKVATHTNYTLVDNGIVAVKFTNANTAASPTLNINSQGAKAIWYQGAALSENEGKIWGAGDIVTFVYNKVDTSSGVYEIISINKDHSIEINNLNPEYTQQKIWIEI